MEEVLNVLKDILLGYWWVIAPIILFFVLRGIWLGHIRGEYIKSLKWVVLEIKIPREVVKTPKAMEQFFTGLHASGRELKFKDKYFKGAIPNWLSVEIVGRGGDIHFFIRSQEKFRDLIESQLYAQYPQAEIYETDDYISSLPADIPNKEYDVIGSEIILDKPDAYPIRTYPVFFEEKEAEERSDPVAGLFEFLNALKAGENVWIQILISPTNDDWKKAAEKLVAKITGKKLEDAKKGSYLAQETGNWLKEFIDGFIGFLTGFFTSGVEEKKDEEKTIVLTPGDKEVVLAIEKNIAKLGFKTMMRFIYWAPIDVFNKDKLSAVGGFFKQFNTQNLNGFKTNKKTAPGRGIVFKKKREIGQKRQFAGLYKQRYFVHHKSDRVFVFNTEELATIFHIPGKFVEVEKMGKIEAKKGGPPTGLPIEL